MLQNIDRVSTVLRYILALQNNNALMSETTGYLVGGYL